MAWVGGKRALRDVILDRFPLYYERYIEVFGGGGWVLFHKPPGYGVTKAPGELSRATAVSRSEMEATADKLNGTDFEVYNDFNTNLTTLYHCVREHPIELKEALRYTLNSRKDFDAAHRRLCSGEQLTDVTRAALFYEVIRHSYAAGCESFGGMPHSMWTNFPLIDKACARLQRVVIENKDFEKLIGQYDRPVSFFYLDPPYFDTENYYSDITFGREGHIRLRDALMQIQGKFLLSYNDCPEIRALYSRPGIYIEEVTRLNNIKQRYEHGSEYAELIISNYDQFERGRTLPVQLQFEI